MAKVIKEPKKRGFIIMNQDGEYFAGLMYGYPVFVFDLKEAKPLYDLHKLKKLESFTHQELVHDFIE